MRGETADALVKTQRDALAKLQKTADTDFAMVSTQRNALASLQKTADMDSATVSTQRDALASLQRTADTDSAMVKTQRKALASLHLTADSDSAMVTTQRKALASLHLSADSDSAKVTTQRDALAPLQHTADTDFLTGIGNRRAIEQRLNIEWARAHRHRRRLAILVVDIDGLKAINDTHGHPTGDVVITEVALRLAGAIRMEDEVGRIGGDEFLIVLPEANGASKIAARLARVVAIRPIQIADSNSIAVQVSIGWASNEAPYESWLKMVAAADARLYRSRKRKRDRITRLGSD